MLPIITRRTTPGNQTKSATPYLIPCNLTRLHGAMKEDSMFGRILFQTARGTKIEFSTSLPLHEQSYKRCSVPAGRIEPHTALIACLHILQQVNLQTALGTTWNISRQDRGHAHGFAARDTVRFTLSAEKIGAAGRTETQGPRGGHPPATGTGPDEGALAVRTLRLGLVRGDSHRVDAVETRFEQGYPAMLAERVGAIVIVSRTVLHRGLRDGSHGLLRKGGGASRGKGAP